jgi:hypothetical protein
LAEEEEKTLAQSPPANAPPEEPLSAEDSLVEALRKFVRREAHVPEAPDSKLPPLKPLQIIILLVIVLDVVLLYGQFQGAFENPLFKFALQALPWLLGATVFAYSDRLRKWILQQARHPLIGVVAVFIGLPLLLIREPVFSAVVNMSSSTVHLQSEDPAEKIDFRALDSTHMRVTVPNLLKSYSVEVTDGNENLHPRGFSHTLSRWEVVRGTFAQLPLVSHFLTSVAIPVHPLYEVMLEPSEKDGWVNVQGHFEGDFLKQVTDLSKNRCSEYRTSSPGAQEVHCQVYANQLGAFPLPPGKYSVESLRQDCKLPKSSTITVPNPDNSIEMEEECPR